MTRRRLEALLWALAPALALGAWLRARRPIDVPAVRSAAESPAPAAPNLVPRAALAAAGDAVRQGNPFRLDRAPAPVGFAADPMAIPEEPAVAPPPPERPPLAVSGIVGPPWAAVLEGVPGRDAGLLVRGGDAVGELRVRSVTRDLVVVQGPDTTWRLTVRRPWQ
jgi:hypothetical protein